MRSRNSRAGSLLPVLALVVAAAGALPAAGSEQDGAAEPVLVAVKEGARPGTYAIVCSGTFEHRLLEDETRHLVAVELPRVRIGMSEERLPKPSGIVDAIALGGGGEEPTRVVFLLNREASAGVARTEAGLQIEFAAAPRGELPRAEASEAAGEAPPPEPAPPETAGVARLSDERPLGTEDLLEISVFEVPELSRIVRISERGTISLPLIGEVEAQGLTRREFEVRLRDLLQERYVQDPQVSVFVTEHGSKKVSVLGAVGKPGVYEMLGRRTLLEILSQAGGLTEDVGAELFVIRPRPDGAGDRIAVSVEGLLVNSDPRLNVPIEPGDIISAPMDRPVYIYVDGAVKTPGRIEQLASRPISLLQAIAKAGGATERANLKEIQILRQSPDGTQTVLEVNLKRIRKGREPDPILGEGDVVVVQETFF